MARPSWRAIGIAAVVAAMVVWSFARRWSLLAESPYPVGIDGYFYAIQVRSLLEHGVLQYPASPLVFWWMAPFAAATDPIVGAKLGAALGGALIAVPAYFVGRRLAKGASAGLVAAALASMSSTSVYLSMEFVKQGIGLAIALAALALVLRAIERWTRGAWLAAGAAALAALLAHKMAGVLVIAIAVPAAVLDARARGQLRGRRLIYAYLAIAAVVIAAAIVGAVSPRRFVSAGDLGNVAALFSTTAHWSLPALIPKIGPTLVFGHDAAFAGILGLIAAVLLLTMKTERSLAERVTAWAFVALALVTALPWLDIEDGQGLAFRLRVAAFVPLALVAATLAGQLPASKLRALVIGIVALAVCIRGPAERGEGRVLAHPALVAAVMAARDQVPRGATLIVPERQVAFMAAWYTRAPVSIRPEPIAPEHRVRLITLAFIRPNSPLDHALDAARASPEVTDPPIGLHARHRNGLVLVPEPTWTWIVAHLPPADAARAQAWPTI